MRSGLVVDGEAEYRSLSKIIPRINTSGTIIGPYRADLQPHASAKKLASAAETAIALFQKKQIDNAIMLIDLENRSVCASDRAAEICSSFSKICKSSGIPSAFVVIKDRTFENWLIADLTALENIKKFEVSEAKKKSIVPDKADNVDGIKTIKSCCPNSDYEKVKDAILIMSRADPYQIAANSRSFRRFLRVVGDTRYFSQSKTP
jgi:hypothetical protein